jgi:hypothetical protein
MKKIILGMFVLFVSGSALTANAQEKPSTTTTTTTTTQGTKYSYYPALDTYYNDATGEYIYYDQPTIKWVTAKTLPATITWDPNAEHYSVYYNGPDVWKDNAGHKTKYKVKKDGSVKQKE